MGGGVQPIRSFTSCSTATPIRLAINRHDAPFSSGAQQMGHLAPNAMWFNVIRCAGTGRNRAFGCGRRVFSRESLRQAGHGGRLPLRVAVTIAGLSRL